MIDKRRDVVSLYLTLIGVVFSLIIVNFGLVSAVDCTKEIFPGESINKYSGSAVAGDIVCVHAGIYSNNLAPSVSGTVSKKIVFKAYPGDECKTDANRVKSGCGVKLTGAVSLAKDNIRIEGFEISGGGDGVHVTGNFNEIVNNYIHNTGAGGVASNSGSMINNLIVRDNEMYQTGRDAILVYGNNILITGNYLHQIECDGIEGRWNNMTIEDNWLGDSYQSSCHQDGIEIGMNPVNGLMIKNNKIWLWTQNIYITPDSNAIIENVDILGNVVWNDKSKYDGINLFIAPYGSVVRNVRIEGNTFGNDAVLITDSYASSSNYYIQNLEVSNNIFYKSVLSLEQNNAAVSHDNILYNPAWFVIGDGKDYEFLADYISKNPGQQAGSRQIDPKLVNPGAFDFHLASGSPAIDSGKVVSLLVVDMDGKTRPQGAGFDIGAYEFGSVIAPSSVVEPELLVEPQPVSEQNPVVVLPVLASPVCKENWSCSAWGSCINKIQSRSCFDINKCGTSLYKPLVKQSCVKLVCKTSRNSWQNSRFTSRTGNFTAEFDIIPNSSNLDGVIGLSKGNVYGYNKLALSVRFNPKGFIDVRDGEVYSADNTVPYIPGVNYHFKISVNVPAKRYSVKVSYGSSGEISLASDYDFRTEQNRVLNLNNYGFIGKGFKICGFKSY